MNDSVRDQLVRLVIEELAADRLRTETVTWPHMHHASVADTCETEDE